MRMMFNGYHGRNRETDANEGQDRLAKILLRASKYAKELDLPCLFAEDGSPVSNDLLRKLTEDEATIIAADPDKLRRVIQFMGRILHYDE